jgi:alcohol dehydrogenase class IV
VESNEPPSDALPVAARDFLAPRLLLSGTGSSARIGQALRDAGTRDGNVVVVADRVVSEAGLLDATVGGLANAGFSPLVFGGVAGEPDAQLVRDAGEFARRHGAAAVVGVGGGSSLDTAKLVALLAVTGGELTDVVAGAGPGSHVAPLALVPTTTGTGSEATRIAMFSVGGRKRIVNSPAFVPLVAALDPQLVTGLPGPVVAATGMDALAHAIESILSRTRSSLTIALAADAAELVIAEIEAAAIGEAADARGRMLFAAYLAGLGLNAGVVLGHSIGYVLARRAHLAHGVSCSLALPYCVAYARSVDPHVVARISLAVCGEVGSDLDDCAVAIEQLARRLGLPVSLQEVGIGAADLDELAVEVVRDYPRPNNPVALDEERVRRLLGFMLEGDVEGACAAMAEAVPA